MAKIRKAPEWFQPINQKQAQEIDISRAQPTFGQSVKAAIGAGLKLTQDTIDEMARPSYIPRNEYLENKYGENAKTDMFGIKGGIAGAVHRMGEELSNDGNKGAQNLVPYSTEWWRHYGLQGLGSSLPLMAGTAAALRNGNFQAVEQGAANLATRLGAGARFANLFGEGTKLGTAGVAAAHPEATAESVGVYDDVYKKAVKEGKSPLEADALAKMAMDKNYKLNIGIIPSSNLVENVLTFGSSKVPGGRIVKALGTTGMNALEEGAQSVASDVAKGERINFDQAMQDAAIGGLTGAGFHAFGKIVGDGTSRSSNPAGNNSIVTPTAEQINQARTEVNTGWQNAQQANPTVTQRIANLSDADVLHQAETTLVPKLQALAEQGDNNAKATLAIVEKNLMEHDAINKLLGGETDKTSVTFLKTMLAQYAEPVATPQADTTQVNHTDTPADAQPPAPTSEVGGTANIGETLLARAQAVGLRFTPELTQVIQTGNPQAIQVVEQAVQAKEQQVQPQPQVGQQPPVVQPHVVNEQSIPTQEVPNPVPQVNNTIIPQEGQQQIPKQAPLTPEPTVLKTGAYGSIPLVEPQNYTKEMNTVVNFGKMLGVNVQFLNDTNVDGQPSPNGLYMGDGNTVYVRANPGNSKPMYWIMGHEYAHFLIETRPQLAKYLLSKISDDQARAYHQELVNRGVKRQYDINDQRVIVHMKKEILSDTLANGWLKPEFWDNVHATQPKSVVDGMVDLAKKFIAKIKATVLKNGKIFQGEEYVKFAQDTIADIELQFQKAIANRGFGKSKPIANQRFNIFSGKMDNVAEETNSGTGFVSNDELKEDLQTGQNDFMKLFGNDADNVEKNLQFIQAINNIYHSQQKPTYQSVRNAYMQDKDLMAYFGRAYLDYYGSVFGLIQNGKVPKPATNEINTASTKAKQENHVEQPLAPTGNERFVINKDTVVLNRKFTEPSERQVEQSGGNIENLYDPIEERFYSSRDKNEEEVNRNLEGWTPSEYITGKRELSEREDEPHDLYDVYDQFKTVHEPYEVEAEPVNINGKKYFVHENTVYDEKTGRPVVDRVTGAVAKGTTTQEAVAKAKEILANKAANTTNKSVFARIKAQDKAVSNQASEQLVKEYGGLVRSIAERYASKLTDEQNGRLDVDDLIQEGNIGLLKSAEAYNGFNPDTFEESFAPRGIANAILDAINRDAHATKISKTLTTRMREYNKAFDAWVQAHGTEPSDAQMAVAMKLSTDQIKDIKDALATEKSSSLDKTMNDDEGDTGVSNGSQIADTTVEQDRSKFHNVIDRGLNKLTPEERAVVENRYYFGEQTKANQPRPYESIAKNLGITPEDAQRLDQSALEKLNTLKIAKNAFRDTTKNQPQADVTETADNPARAASEVKTYKADQVKKEESVAETLRIKIADMKAQLKELVDNNGPEYKNKEKIIALKPQIAELQKELDTQERLEKAIKTVEHLRKMNHNGMFDTEIANQESIINNGGKITNTHVFASEDLQNSEDGKILANWIKNKMPKSLRTKFGIVDKDIKVNLPQDAKYAMHGGQGYIEEWLASPSYIAKNYPQFSNIFKLANSSYKLEERLKQKFRNTLDEIYGKLLGNDEKLIEVLTKLRLMSDAQHFDIIDTGSTGKKPKGARFMTQEELDEIGATPEVVEAFKQLRKHYDTMHDATNSIRKRMGLDDMGYLDGYVPHFFQSYKLTFEGKGGRKTIHSSYRTLLEAKQEAQKLKDQGYTGLEVSFIRSEMNGGSIEKAFIEDDITPEQERDLEEVLRLEDYELEGDIQQLISKIAKESNNHRFLGHAIHRKGARGWSENLKDVDYSYSTKTARYIALEPFKTKAVSAWEAIFGNGKEGSFQAAEMNGRENTLARYARQFILDVNGNPTNAEKFFTEALSLIPGLRNYMGARFGDRWALQFSNNITAMTTVAKLGFFNASTGIMQLTQVLNTSALVDYKYVKNALPRAMKLAFYQQIFGKDIRTAEEKRIIDLVNNDADITNASGYAQSKSGLWSAVGKFQELGQKSMIFFKWGDTMSRYTAILAAYQHEMSRSGDDQKALAFAKEVNDKANFNYSVVDAPYLFRKLGPIGQIMLQFKKYMTKEGEFLIHLAKEGNRMQNMKFWIPFLLVAGLNGFPVWEIIKGLARFAFDVDPEIAIKEFLVSHSNNPFTHALSNTVMYGALSNIPGGLGIDIGKRAGLSDMMPTSLSGIAPAINSVINTYRIASENDWQVSRVWPELIKQITPGLGNMAQATVGEVRSTTNRERVNINYTPSERIVRALGFMPVRESVQRDTSYMVKYDEDKLRKEITRAKDAYYFNPTAENAERLADLGVNMSTLKKDMKREDKAKNQERFDRALDAVPKKRRNKYDDYKNYLEYEEE